MRGQSPYRFGGFELDTARRRLTAPDGSLCPLSSRGYEALLHLLENRDRLVSKEELIQAIWPRTVVEENNLNQAISAVRRALGDNRENPRFILTIAGRGYQFIGAVEAEAVEPALGPIHRQSDVVHATTARSSEPDIGTDGGPPESMVFAQPGPPPANAISRRRLLAALGGGTAALASAGYWWFGGDRTARPPQSLAVLPFRPLAGTQGDPAIELGVAELLVTRLSTLPGLTVAPLSSVTRYAGAATDRSAAGKALGVEAVLDGNVQVRDDRIRLTARLIETATGRTLWADDFTERLDDFFEVQDSLVTQLVEALTPHLPADATRRAVRHETTDVEAWQLYANGRYHVGRRNEASLRKAIEFFSAAVARDPNFSLALAGLSETWSLTAVFDLEPPVAAFEQARVAAAQAIRADPDLADGYAALGQVVTQMDRDLGAGRALYRRALALEPEHALAHTFMALNLTQAGRHAAAIEAIAKAQQLEPASLVFSSVAGLVEYMSRDLDEAERRLASVLRAVPDAPLPRHFLARVMLARGRGAEVLDLMAGHNEPAPGSFSTLGRAYAQAGRRDEAAGEVARLEQLAARGFGVGFDLAQIHVDIGNRDAAITELTRAIDDHSQLGGYVNVEPALDPLRDDPRFAPIAARMARF